MTYSELMDRHIHKVSKSKLFTMTLNVYASERKKTEELAKKAQAMAMDATARAYWAHVRKIKESEDTLNRLHRFFYLANSQEEKEHLYQQVQELSQQLTQ